VLERTKQIAYLTQTSNHVITLKYCRHHYYSFTTNIA